MGFFDNFPYTNFHELNADWVVEVVKRAVEDVAETQKFVTEYINSDEFKRAINNQIQYFIDSGQIEDIIAQQFYPKLQVAPYSSFITVGKSGCVCKTINEAISLVKTYPDTQRNVGIVIMPGDYMEEIVEPDLFGMGFFGIGMPRIMFNSVYPRSPLYSAGRATFCGIHFLAMTSSNNSYALHIESQIYDTLTDLKFYGCRFESQGLHACGMGFGKNASAEFWDCVCMGKTAVYAHNYPVANSDVSSLRMYNCSLFGVENDIALDDALRLHGNDETGQSLLVLSFGGCRGNNGKVVVRDGSTTKTGVYQLLPGRLVLEKTSVNTLPGVDFYKCLITVQGVYPGSGAYAFVPAHVLLSEYKVQGVAEDGTTWKEFLEVVGTNCIRVTTTSTNPNLTITYIPR